MNTMSDVKPILAKRILSGKVLDAIYYYNPDGYGGIIIVDEEGNDIISYCNGETSVAGISKIFGNNEEELNVFIEMLIKKQILFIDNNKKLIRKPSKKTISCWMHVTNTCNLDCTYCFIHKSPGDMSIDIAKMTIDKLIDSCIKNEYSDMSIKFSGGEPTMKMDFLKTVVDYVRENSKKVNCRFSVLSNGTLINDGIATYLKENKIEVGISLDGIGDMHDKNRKKRDGKGSYNDTIDGINKLLSFGIRPSIMVTVSSSNINGLTELTKMLTCMKLHFRFSLERDTSAQKPSVLNCTELKSVLSKCISIMESMILNGNTDFSFQFGDVNFNKPSKRVCGAGSSFFAVGNNGELGVCGLGLEKTFSDIFDVRDIIQDIRTLNHDLVTVSSQNIPGCKKCIWNTSCASCCPIQTSASYGTYNSISPYCDIYKSLLPEVLHLYALHTYVKGKQKEYNNTVCS